MIKIRWDNDKDDEYSKRVIVRIGVLLGHLRAVVTTWETQGSQGLDYNYAFFEYSTRLVNHIIFN